MDIDQCSWTIAPTVLPSTFGMNMPLFNKDPSLITTIDMHTQGEPVRILTKQLKYPKSLKNLLEKRTYFNNNLDHYRVILNSEPRGHEAMYGVIVLEPDEGMGDIAVLFTHNEGYSTMCGHASLALCRYLIDAKLIPLPYNVVEDSIFNFTLQCPCGPIQCSTKLVLDKLSNEIISNKNHEASYIGVKSFNVALDLNIEFKNDIKFFKNYTNFYLDLSFGGAFYCLLDLTQLDLNLNDIIIKNKRKNFVDNDNNDENFLVDTSALSSSSCDLDTVLEFGKSLLKFLKNQEKITNLLNHENSDLNFLYGLILTDGDPFKLNKSELTTTNICIFANGQIDRSPCGSGIQARMATFYSKNSKIKVLNKTVLFKSIIHSKFKGKIVKFFDNDSSSKRSFDVLVEVSGTANYTGLNHFLVEDNDSLGNGFLI